MDIEELKQNYHEVLSKINAVDFAFEEDKYSGVFLPFQFEAYKHAKPKVMIIGRETASWNTENNKNTLQRIIDKNAENSLNDIIDEALCRYKWHLKTGPDGELRKKHKSDFQRYYSEVAKKLNLSSDAMIYSNLFAWDYNKKSPLTRPSCELSKIIEISLELLAIQIRFFDPEYIVFATGCRKIDRIIKQLFKVHFNGHTTQYVNPKKLWAFKAAKKQCFRIAHPRALYGHYKFRQQLIEILKNDSDRKGSKKSIKDLCEETLIHLT